MTLGIFTEKISDLSLLSHAVTNFSRYISQNQKTVDSTFGIIGGKLHSCSY
jgi:hypothetical protein